MLEQSTPPFQPQSVTENRIDAAVVTVIVTTYRDGRPIGERTTQPVKIFRAAHPDLWQALDNHLNGSRQDRRPDSNGTG